MQVICSYFFPFYDLNKLHVDVLTESQAEFLPDFYVDFYWFTLTF